MAYSQVRFIVPYLTDPGGIQRYALDYADWMRGSIDIRLLDWQSPQRVDAEVGSLTHFWHIDPLLAASSDPKTALLTCHGIEIAKSRLPRRRNREIAKALNSVLRVLVPSAFTKRYVCEHFDVPPQHVVVLPPLVCPPAGPPEVKEGRTAAFSVGTLCRLVPRKNVLGVIEALEQLQRRSEADIDFTLVGTGPQKEEILRRLRTSSINWRYLGQVDEATKWQFYRSLDVFCLPVRPSRRDFEGFGIVYTEANTVGVPTIGVAAGGVTDAIKEDYSGNLLAKGDTMEIVGALERAMSSSKAMRTSALEWSRLFRPDVLGPRLLAQYQSLGVVQCPAS